MINIYQKLEEFRKYEIKLATIVSRGKSDSTYPMHEKLEQTFAAVEKSHVIDDYQKRKLHELTEVWLHDSDEPPTE